MCFTILLGSWIVLHGSHLVTASGKPEIIQPSTLNNVALLVYMRVNETHVTADEVRWSLETIKYNLQNVDLLTTCDNDTSTTCLESIKCPNEVLLNETGFQHDNYNQYFMMLQTNDPHTIAHHEVNHVENSEKPSATEVWGFGMLSVGIISLSGLFGGLLWPLMSSKYYDHAMRMLIGLAVGTLTATSTMQLVPQGFGMKETDVHSYLQTSVIMLSSLWFLYMFEISCKICFHSKKKEETKTETQIKVVGMNDECNKQAIIEQEGLLPTIVTDSTNRRPSLRPFFSSKTSLNVISPFSSTQECRYEELSCTIFYQLSQQLQGLFWESF